jgi:hypothetical protein
MFLGWLQQEDKLSSNWNVGDKYAQNNVLHPVSSIKSRLKAVI